MTGEELVIRGGTIVHPADGRLEPGEVWIEEGRIARPRRGASEEIDATGLYVSPGFIDLQVNGGVGHNFEDASPEEIDRIVGFHVSHGTTGLLPTTVTAPIPAIRRAMARVREAGHAAILGMHIEGPFISPARKGAHNPKHIIAPSVEGFDELASGYSGFIAIVTLAPELPGADGVIARIREIGAIPSLGHSNATYEEGLAAIERGVRLFTHVFNGMRRFRHRAPGAVGAGLVSDVMVELIADRIHVHPGAIRLLYKVKGPEQIALVTDAISAAGLPDGEYGLGGLEISVREGIARLTDGTLAGSTLTMDRAVRVYMEATGCSLPEAVRAASLNPAGLLGIDDRKGEIEGGKDADIVIFDRDLTVHYTLINGEVAYARDRQG